MSVYSIRFLLLTRRQYFTVVAGRDGAHLTYFVHFLHDNMMCFRCQSSCPAVPVCWGDGTLAAPNWGWVSLQTSGSVWRNKGQKTDRQQLQDLLSGWRAALWQSEEIPQDATWTTQKTATVSCLTDFNMFIFLPPHSMNMESDCVDQKALLANQRQTHSSEACRN